MLKEFKEFAMKGNVMDLAIGVVIGGAFQKIVTSLVGDIIMPSFSILTGKLDFSTLVLTVGDVSIKYGNFITAIVDFLIISFSIFLLVRYINKLNKANKLKELNDKLVQSIDKKGKLKKLHKKETQTKSPEPTTKICPYCLSEIKYKATKCPHCTSDQPEIAKESNDSKN